jgi:hypothetical protein
MNNRPRRKAKAFLKEYRISRVTLEELRRIITGQGYTIVEFNPIFNDEHVAALIEALHLEEMVEKTKAFTYADRQRRLVFLHEDLSDQEKLLVLAHEEGHIYCGHFSSVPVIGRDVVEEHEANEFTHYILNRGIAGTIGGFIQKKKKLLGTIAIILSVAMIGLLVFKAIQKELSYYGEYYITASGNKYHEEECIFVKDKTNIHRMTVEEYESGDYEPCGICLPHSNTNTESGD